MEEQKSPLSKPKMTSGKAQQEVDRVEKEFDEFQENLTSLASHGFSSEPKQEQDRQTHLSSKEIKSLDIYLKPERSIPDRQKFNEKFRDAWNHAKEYVHFIAENKELIGEAIEIWTHPFGGVGAEFWKVPTNKPIWAPRYLAEQIERKSYHRFTMDNTTTNVGNGAQMYGNMAIDSTIKRLAAFPVSERKSMFSSSSRF